MGQIKLRPDRLKQFFSPKNKSLYGRLSHSAAIIFIIAAIVISVSAHVPIEGGGNDRPDSALIVDDPTKSWVVYDHLDHPGEVKYYLMEMKTGDELRLSLFTPEKSGFVPNLVVMGPGIQSSEILPDYVEVNEGEGAMIIRGVAPDKAQFEPFTPSALYQAAKYSTQIEVPGKYYAAVFEPDETGNFGLAIGYREEFTLSEYILVPFSVINIRIWEGQSLLPVFAPLILILILGLGLFYAGIKRKTLSLPGMSGLLAVFAGLLYIGTGAMTTLQLAIAFSKTGPESTMLVTVIFILISVFLGVSAIMIGIHKNENKFRKNSLLMILIGILGLFFWSGLIIGPLLVMLAGVICLVSRGGE